VIASYTLYDQGEDVTGYVEARFSHFASRCVCNGYPGDYLTALTYLNGGSAQRALNEAIEPEEGLGSRMWVSEEGSEREPPLLGRRNGSRRGV